MAPKTYQCTRISAGLYQACASLTNRLVKFVVLFVSAHSTPTRQSVQDGGEDDLSTVMDPPQPATLGALLFLTSVGIGDILGEDASRLKLYWLIA